MLQQRHIKTSQHLLARQKYRRGLFQREVAQQRSLPFIVATAMKPVHCDLKSRRTQPGIDTVRYDALCAADLGTSLQQAGGAVPPSGLCRRSVQPADARKWNSGPRGNALSSARWREMRTQRALRPSAGVYLFFAEITLTSSLLPADRQQQRAMSALRFAVFFIA